jgi:hypothetical protein
MVSNPFESTTGPASRPTSLVQLVKRQKPKPRQNLPLTPSHNHPPHLPSPFRARSPFSIPISALKSPTLPTLMPTSMLRACLFPGLVQLLSTGLSLSATSLSRSRLLSDLPSTTGKPPQRSCVSTSTPSPNFLLPSLDRGRWVMRSDNLQVVRGFLRSSSGIVSVLSSTSTFTNRGSPSSTSSSLGGLPPLVSANGGTTTMA